MTYTQRKETADSSPWAMALAVGEGPRYRRLADFIERASGDGTLKPGDRMPAQRALAALLGVDLTTVTRGYNDARRRGLIESRGPLGTFIAPPRAKQMQRVDLSMNIPPAPVGMDMEVLLREGLSRLLARSDADLLMTYQVGGGSPRDWEAAAHWLAPVLGEVSSSHVVVCPGAQAALATAVLAFTAPGDVVLCEPLVYPGLPHAVAQLGRALECVAADAHGMRADALDAALAAQPRARLLYLNPTLQNPTAATMPEARRRQIVEVAARRGVRILEDDPYWRFAPDAPPPLARLAPRQVCYLSTLSKVLSPGLRTALLVVPDIDAKTRFLGALRSFSLMAAPLTSALAIQWIEEGLALDIFNGVRDEASERQRLAAQVLGSAAPGAGIHLWYELPRYWAAQDLVAAARSEGLAVAPSTAFAALAREGAEPGHAIRVSLGAAADRAHLQAALRRLSALLADDVSASARVIV